MSQENVDQYHRAVEALNRRDLVQLWTVRDGRSAFLRVFQTKAEALKAAGLSE